MEELQLKLEGVTVRHLTVREYSYGNGNKNLPVMIEATSDSKLPFLKKLLSEESKTIFQMLQEYGAVLFRGFRVNNESDFENVLPSFDPFNPIADYFMSEDGRFRVPGTRHIFPTNTLYATGGGFKKIRGFHTENFYSLDVPEFISFWCKTSPVTGGETGLIDMEMAYEALSSSCKENFEKESVELKGYMVAEIARRYDLTETKVIEFFKDRDIPFKVHEGQTYVLIRKPCIYINPYTGKKSLMVHLSAKEIVGADFDPEVRELLAKNYSSVKWLLHRFVWERPKLLRFLVYQIPTWINRLQGHVPPGPGMSLPPNLRRHLTKEEVRALAAVLSKKICLFRWKAGDVLLINNTRVAHAGMPGIGFRTLRAMLGNPLPLHYPVSTGIWEPGDPDGYRSFDELLRGLEGDALV